MSETRSSALAAAADGLTTLRAVIGPALALFIWAGEWGGVAIMLAVAWLTDLADGRLARRSGSHTRLGRWDMTIDTVVGASLLIGLMLAGEIPTQPGILALAILGYFHLKGNLAASMLLQLSGYVPTLLILWTRRPPAWWMPFAAIVVIAAIDWRRLIFVNIPAFLRGVRGRFEGGRARTP